MFFAICCALVLPDFPHTTKWLTAEQRAYAAWRLKMDAEEEDDRHATSVGKGLMLALKDWRLYVFMLMLHANVLAGTFQYIFPSIVQTLGFGRIQTLLLTVRIQSVFWTMLTDIRSRCGFWLGLWLAVSPGTRIELETEPSISSLGLLCLR